MTNTKLSALLVGLSLAACSGNTLDIGSNGRSDASASDAPSDGRKSVLTYAMATSACSSMTTDVLAMLRASCNFCHGDVFGQGEFGPVLDIDYLVFHTATGPQYNRMRYLVPGDPQQSLIYKKVIDGHVQGENAQEGATQFAVPTVSDASLFYAWILDCLGPDPLAPPR